MRNITFIAFFLAFILFSSNSHSQVTLIEEARQLGSIAGQGKACNSQKIKTFEMLSHAIILTKSPSPQETQVLLKAFIDEKVRAYMLTKTGCSQILRAFDNQQIFMINVYQDGTLQMPDGTIITPVTPYDATTI